MATFGTSTTCQIGEDGRTATARTSGTECAFAYSSEPLGGGFHRWTLAVQRAPPEEGGEAPAGWGVCIGVVADGAPTKRLPAASRAPLAPTAAGWAGVVSGVHLDGTSAYSLGAPSYAPLPAGTPDMTAVWDGKLSRDQAETRPFLDLS